jgi:hypothetical protein
VYRVEDRAGREEVAFEKLLRQEEAYEEGGGGAAGGTGMGWGVGGAEPVPQGERKRALFLGAGRPFSGARIRFLAMDASI